MQGKVYEKHQFWVVDHQFYQMQVAVKVIHASIEITHGKCGVGEKKNITNKGQKVS